MNSMRIRQLCNLGSSLLLDNLFLGLLLRNRLFLGHLFLLWRSLLFLGSRFLLCRLLFRRGFLLGCGCRVAADGVERRGGACRGQLPRGLSEDSGGEGAEGEDGGWVARLGEGRGASEEETAQSSHRSGHAPGSGKHRARERAESGWPGVWWSARDARPGPGRCRERWTREMGLLGFGDDEGGERVRVRRVCVGERSGCVEIAKLAGPDGRKRRKVAGQVGFKVRIMIPAETPPRNLETLESTNQRRCAIPTRQVKRALDMGHL
jgi:hypothetical protein